MEKEFKIGENKTLTLCCNSSLWRWMRIGECIFHFLPSLFYYKNVYGAFSVTRAIEFHWLWFTAYVMLDIG